MKILISAALFFLNFLVLAQTKQAKFQVKKSNNRIIFKAHNKSDYDQQVTLYFKSINGLYGYSEPVTKRIPAGKKIDFLELRFNGKYSYNYSYRSKAVPTSEQKVAWKEKIKPYEFEDNQDLNSGIVVFSKERCSACRVTMDYLIKNKIEFDYIDISSSSKNNNLMWKTLRDHGIRLNRVSTPVILVDGNLHHSFKDLRQFLKTLDNKKFKAK